MGWIILILGVLLLGLAVILFLMKWLIVGGILIILSLILFSGLRTVRPEERWVIELLGHFFRVLRPGLQWVLPGLMRVRAKVSIWEQTLPLFGTAIKIDFRNGSATPNGAVAYLQIRDSVDDIYRVIYGIATWKKSAVSLLENALRSYLNSLTIEEGLEQGRAGYNFLERMPEGERDGIIASLDRWGIQLNRVTVVDFDLDETVIKAREAVLEAERRKVAATQSAMQKALESGGMHSEIVKILTAPFPDGPGYSLIDADRVAKEYVMYYKGTETGRIIDWRGGGEGDLSAVIARIITAATIAKEAAEKEKK